MKRTFAVVMLLASLGVLIKLATKPTGPSGVSRIDPDAGGEHSRWNRRERTAAVTKNDLLARYGEPPRRMCARWWLAWRSGSGGMPI